MGMGRFRKPYCFFLTKSNAPFSRAALSFGALGKGIKSRTPIGRAAYLNVSNAPNFKRARVAIRSLRRPLTLVRFELKAKKKGISHRKELYRKYLQPA